MRNRNLSLIKIEEKDRTKDGNLLPEVRSRTLKEIQWYLSCTGYLNVSVLADQLGLSRQTTRVLVDEVLDEIREVSERQILAQIPWYHSALEELEEMYINPEEFSEEKIEVIKVKAVILGRLNAVQKLLGKRIQK